MKHYSMMSEEELANLSKSKREIERIKANLITKLYLVCETAPHEGGTLHGVYSNKEGAMKRLKEIEKDEPLDAEYKIEIVVLNEKCEVVF